MHSDDICSVQPGKEQRHNNEIIGNIGRSKVLLRKHLVCFDIWKPPLQCQWEGWDGLRAGGVVVEVPRDPREVSQHCRTGDIPKLN